MRLLYVIHQFFPDCHSGTEQYCLATAREARRRGDDVTVLSLNWRHDREVPPIDVFEAPYDGFRVLRLDHWRGLNRNDVLRDYENHHLDGPFQGVLDDVRPDAIHFFHLRQLGSNLIGVARRRGIRTVVNLMDFWYLCPRFTLLRADGTLCEGPPDGGAGCVACHHPELTGIEPAAATGPQADKPPERLRALLDRPQRQLANLLLADEVIAPSAFLADMFAKNGFPRERMRIVPYGLEPDRMTTIPTVRPRQPLRLGFCGVLSPWKAPHIAVDAVLGTSVEVELTVHGRTNEPMFQDYIDRMTASAAEDPRITFPGAYSAADTPRVFADMDALIVPSTWYENTPFVVLEAFAAGVPVIASNLGGLSEVVQEDQNGWLFEAGDVAGLRAILARIAGDPDLLRQLRPPRPVGIAQNYDLFAGLYRDMQERPFGFLSRHGKRWYRQLLDAKDRLTLRMRRRRGERPVAVVASTWRWPHRFHTFVYQEMVGLEQSGLDVRVFHWDLGDVEALSSGFRPLLLRRTQLQPVIEINARDKRHFDRTRPGRLRALLERVAEETHRDVADLEREPLVLQACTFARMAELAGAGYLHSYFFYDQSFMAMVAAWLLEIPRGVTCYADHVLEDYPFKLVRLQVELADLVVATSQRVKREISEKSGGQFDDKILVKPNSVDGAGFPSTHRPPRSSFEPFEIVSVSRIEAKKGLTFLVEAVAELKRRGHEVIVHIAGDSDPSSPGSVECKRELLLRIAELGVQREVVLHGLLNQGELVRLLQRCHAFVAPYVETRSGDKDGIPTAILEAMASGLPVVTTDAGSIPEAVTDDVEGIIVPQRDAATLADSLQRLMTDEALVTRLGRAANTRFTAAFDAGVTEKPLGERVRSLLQLTKG